MGPKPRLLLIALVSGFYCTAGSVIVSQLSELPLDENGKLETHVLVYPAGPCQELIQAEIEAGEQINGLELRASTGFALEALLPPNSQQHAQDATDVKDCATVCLERGMDQSLLSAALPQRYYHARKSEHHMVGRSFADWLWDECLRVEVGFMNYYDRDEPLRMYWVNPNGKRKFRTKLGYGESHTYCLSSYIGHVFEFDALGETVYRHKVEFTSMVGIGEINPNTEDFECSVEENAAEIFDDMWASHANVTRTFSPLGFRTGRLPDDIFGSMGAFYYNNRQFKIREEFESCDVHINWWEARSNFIQVPWDLKEIWQERLLQLVEDWVGVPLEQTDMYGLRQYETGSRLLTHVDRESTHAASLIVNIAQGNIAEPWPIEIHDHANRLHEIPMQPGDIVYYESAACLHGRMRPLQGDGAYYVNLFTHYRPVGDPDWAHRSNPEGTPERLLDVGDCRLEKRTNQLGVGAATCDNPRIGPYLSTALFTPRSGDDLFDWWTQLGLQYVEGWGAAAAATDTDEILDDDGGWEDQQQGETDEEL